MNHHEELQKYYFHEAEFIGKKSQNQMHDLDGKAAGIMLWSLELGKTQILLQSPELGSHSFFLKLLTFSQFSCKQMN